MTAKSLVLCSQKVDKISVHFTYFQNQFTSNNQIQTVSLYNIVQHSQK